MSGVELASVIVNLGLFVATVIAASIAWRAVKDAREANDAARGHEANALSAATSATEAAQRSATALERQAAVAEASMVRAPWKVASSEAHRWKITNTSGQKAEYVQVVGRPERHLMVMGKQSVFEVEKNESFFILFGGGMSDPASLNVEISWRDVGGTGQSESFTIP